MTFRVLYVCTGNICRSPMAERMLASRAGAALEVLSAGTRPLIDYPMETAAALVASSFGASPEGHRAQEATPALVESCDLVLCATAEHRDAVLRHSPRMMRRAFTMREFVRLGATAFVDSASSGSALSGPALSGPALSGSASSGPASSGPASLAERVALVAAQRGIAPPPEFAGADDVGDPFGGTLDQMTQCGGLISATVDSTLQILGIAPVV